MEEAVAVLDARGRIVWTNRAMEQFLGEPGERRGGGACCTALHGTAPLADCPFERVRRAPGRQKGEFRIPGTDRWVEVTADPIRDGSGRFMGAVHIVSDVTARRLAESEAAENAMRLVSLMNNIPGVVYRGLPDWSVVFIGEGVEDLTGYPAARFLSRALCYRDLIHPEDLPGVRQTFRCAVKERRRVLRVEYRLIHSGGDVRWIADRRQLFYDGDGRFAYVDGLLLDITARKLADESLRVTTEKLKALVTACPLPIVAVDLQGLVTLWNPAAERVFGWGAQEAAGRHRSRSRSRLAPSPPAGGRRSSWRRTRTRCARWSSRSSVEPATPSSRPPTARRRSPFATGSGTPSIF